MKHTVSPQFSHAQRGVALMVALIMLLVMTMIAVVAMRTTTVDLKMTTNTVLSRRAFQSSEGSRTAIGKMLETHVFYRGWPASIGGNVPATSKFPIPVEVEVINNNSNLFLGNNGTLADLGPPTFSRDPDVKFKVDTNGNEEPDNTDMFSSIWITRTGSMLAAGSSGAQGAGYLGPGVGASGAGAHVYFDLRSRGQAPGNATNLTGADYRVLVRN